MPRQGIMLRQQTTNRLLCHNIGLALLTRHYAWEILVQMTRHSDSRSPQSVI